LQKLLKQGLLASLASVKTLSSWRLTLLCWFHKGQERAPLLRWIVTGSTSYGMAYSIKRFGLIENCIRCGLGKQLVLAAEGQGREKLAVIALGLIHPVENRPSFYSHLVILTFGVLATERRSTAQQIHCGTVSLKKGAL